MANFSSVRRCVASAVSAMLVAVTLVFTGSGLANAAVSDPSPAYGPVAGGTQTSMTVAGETNLAQISTNIFHALGLDDDGNLYAWGSNSYGQLGDGTTVNRVAPVRVDRGEIPDDVSIEQMAPGWHFSYVLGSDGNIYAWGSNQYGQLGDSTTTSSRSPVRADRGEIPSDVRIEKIYSAGNQVISLGSDGNIYAWGENQYGQLGDGTATNRSTPVLSHRGAIPDGVTFAQISTGWEFTLALGSDGNAYTWGRNDYDQLGIGRSGSYSTAPSLVIQGAIPSDVTIEQVAAGERFATVLGSDNRFYSWGENTWGQLGDGTTTKRSSPVVVQRGVIPEGLAIERLFSAGHSAYALGIDGNYYAWGNNESLQLGIGSQGARITAPVLMEQWGAIPSDVSIEEMLLATGAVFVLGSDGKFYAWGQNGWGGLGVGSTSSRINAATLIQWSERVTGVTFGGISGTNLSQNSAGVVSVRTPAHPAGMVDVVVQWTLNGFTQPPLTKTNAFTYVEQPMFLTDPADQTVAAGSTGQFTVSTTAGTTVNWEVSTNQGASWAQVVPTSEAIVSPNGLVLTVLGDADSGGNQYRAVASNVVGTATSGVATLTVVFEPGFLTNPADQTVPIGQNATFSVITDTSAEVTWEFSPSSSGTWDPVITGSGVTVSADGLTLTVTATATNDGSRYRAIATNIAGTITSAAADLAVVEPPVLITDPVDQVVAVGSTAVFTVVVDNADTVVWEVSADAGASWNSVAAGPGVTISAGGIRLDVVGTADNNGSRYRAAASNIAGSVTSGVASLTIVASPGFVTNPADQIIAVGQEAVFTVSTDSVSRVSWEISADNGTSWNPITIGPGVTVSDDGMTLTIAGAAGDNGNKYRAIAENAGGTTMSAAATLTVVELPVLITDPVDQVVAVGSTAEFTVVVNNADVVVWEVSADAGTSWNAVASGPGIRVAGQGRTLHVVGSAANNSHQYRAVASNVAGAVNSAGATLTVLQDPQFISDPVDQEVVLGAQAVFTVATDAPATVSWQMSSTNRSTWVSVLPDTGITVSADGLTLTVIGSAETDRNYYRAIATNLAGVALSASAQLRVVEAPVFITSPADQFVATGTEAVFAVVASAPSTVAWQASTNDGVTWDSVSIDQSAVISADTFSLSVTGTSINNGFRYRAVASNIAGMTTSGAATLTVIFAPTFISDPVDQTVFAGELAVFNVSVAGAEKVSWEVSIDGGTTWEAAQRGKAVLPYSLSFTLPVVGTPAKNGYLYRAVASNLAETVTSAVATLFVTDDGSWVDPHDKGSSGQGGEHPLAKGDGDSHGALAQTGVDRSHVLSLVMTMFLALGAGFCIVSIRGYRVTIRRQLDQREK